MRNITDRTRDPLTLHTYVGLKPINGTVLLTVHDSSRRTLTKSLALVPTSLVGYLRRDQNLFFNFSDQQKRKWGRDFVLQLFDTAQGLHTSLQPVP